MENSLAVQFSLDYGEQSQYEKWHIKSDSMFNNYYLMNKEQLFAHINECNKKFDKDKRKKKLVLWKIKKINFLVSH